jgi:TetR/AcrR family transcriptional repressor of nem operon
MLVRRQGYAATSVEEICTAAGVTKGAFFHHFASKEALGAAAAERWTARAQELIFTLPPWVRIEDPLERLIAHIDFRLFMIEGPAEGFTCFVGTMVQESFATSEVLRAASETSIHAYCERLAVDIEAAIARYGTREEVSALSLAYHVQAVLQGAFVIAKARNNTKEARESVLHLKRYIRFLFSEGGKK